mgnify:CR=1 FL=1
MPRIAFSNQQVPFLLGGTAGVAVDTVELAPARPIDRATADLLKVSFAGSGSTPVALGLPDTVKLTISSGSRVSLTPIFGDTADTRQALLDAHGLRDYFTRPGAAGHGLLCFQAQASASATGSSRFRYSALTATVALDTGADAAYAFVRPFDVAASAQQALTDFFHEMRLPEQGERAPLPGEAIALEFGGYLQLGTTVAAGYQLTGTKSFAVGQLALSEHYDLSVVGSIGLSARVAGRYRILLTAGADPGWARVRVTRHAERQLRCAADVKVDVANELNLPGSAREFLGAALGINGKNFITLFDRALELSEFTAFRAATDGLAQKFVEAIIGKAFDVLSSEAEFNNFLALVRRVTASYAQVSDRAVTLFDRYFDRLESELAPFLERVQRAADSGLAELQRGLTPEQWTVLAQLTDGDPLAFLTGQVTVDGQQQDGRALLRARATAVLDLVRDRGHDDLRRVIATAREQFGLDRFFHDLASLDTVDKLKAVANETLGLFVTRLVGRRLDSSANLKEALAAVQAVLRNVDAFATKLFTAFKEASNSSYGLALHAEYSRASASDALVDVAINVTHPRAAGFLRMAGRGVFDDILRVNDPEVVRLNAGVFTHKTTKRAPFKVNVVGWHANYEYEGFAAVIAETEQHLVPGPHGITVYTSASVTLERERRRRDESMHVSFLLRALGESAGVLKSHPRDRDYVVDALTSLSARYELAFTDADTSEGDLREYLAFARELGLDAKGATFEALSLLLPRAANGGFGAVSSHYDVRFGRDALNALLAVDGIPAAAEVQIRDSLRLQVLANYLKRREMRDVAFAYATPEVFDLFAREGAAQFTGHAERAFNIRTRPRTLDAPASVVLDPMELSLLSTLYNIENALVASMKDLYAVLNGPAIALPKFERALTRFGEAMAMFDAFDQTARHGAVGTNTIFVVFDRLVRLASNGPSATAAVLEITSGTGAQAVQQLFLSDAAISTD